jgi:hypothetical protein
MKKQKTKPEYASTEQIMGLLSDEEVARVSNAEAIGQLRNGDEYIDLMHLESGVRRAIGSSQPTGKLLPRKAVHEKTWTKILTRLADQPHA